MCMLDKHFFLLFSILRFFDYCDFFHMEIDNIPTILLRAAAAADVSCMSFDCSVIVFIDIS